jgi:hypothetical protein
MERKGGPLLVAAFRRVLREHPDAKLVIVGCAPPVSAPNCEILGLRPIEEVSVHFQRADIFCMPTRCEPFGIVFVEAMLAGLPVVATKLGALPDMVHDAANGFLIESGDERGLAAALCALLADSKMCAAFGARGAALAEQQYTWENSVAIMRAEMASGEHRGWRRRSIMGRAADLYPIFILKDRNRPRTVLPRVRASLSRQPHPGTPCRRLIGTRTASPRPRGRFGFTGVCLAPAAN